jgi:hypothetical protein
MTWTRNRVLAVGGLSAGAIALAFALFSALGAPDRGVSAAKAADATITSQTVAIGSAKVTVRVLPSGTCFTVTDRDGAAHACPHVAAADDIGFALTPNGVGGLAGPDVRAVIVRLTRKGTVWATLRDGAFYAAVPDGYRARRVVKVLRDGSRTGFAA